VFSNVGDDGHDYHWHCEDFTAEFNDDRNNTGVGVNTLFQDTENFNITYNFTDEGKVEHVSQDERADRTFSWCAGSNSFRNRECSGNKYLTRTDGSMATQEDLQELGENTGEFDIHQDGSSETVRVRIAGNASESNNSNETVGPGSGATGSDDQPTLACETTLNPLTWLACPIIAAANEAIGQFDNAITNELNIDVETYFGDNPIGNSYYTVWSAVRYIALALLVIIGLMMIVSQTFSVGIFDAYTIRKLAPRMAIAIVLISLSWPLLKLMVDLSNAMGVAVRTLMYTAFSGSGGIDSAIGINSEVSGAVAVGGIALGVGLGVLGLLSFALTGLVSALIALAVLVFRKILVIFLVVMAPLAIISFILPNTQKLWKMWSDNFIKALLVFPIIAGFIAIGRVFAATAAQTGDGLLTQVVVFVAYFGPYFALPAVIRLAGGFIATIGGVANDRGRGFFDRNRKYRQGKTSQNLTKMKTGDRFQASNPLAKGFNRATFGVATGHKGNFGIGGSNGKFAAAADLQKRAAIAQAGQNPLMQQLGFDDEAVAALALSGGTRAGGERALRKLQAEELERTGKNTKWTNEKIQRAMNTANAVGFNDVNTFSAAEQMAKNKSRVLAGAYSGDAGMDLVRQSLTAASHGNSQLSYNSMGSFAYHSRNAGRLDLGGEGSGSSMTQGWQRASVGQHSQSYGDSMQAYINHFAGTYNSDGTVRTQGLLQSGNEDDRKAAALAIMEMQNMLPMATGGNQEAINKMMLNLGIDSGQDVSRQLAGETPGLNGVPIAPRIPSLTAQQIRGQARVYDQTPIDQRTGGVDPAAHP
jgi:hypothetical protein